MVKVLAVLIPALVAASFLFFDRQRGGERRVDRPSQSVSSVAVMPEPRFAFISGSADVIDADTVSIHDSRVRLFGIDAPERGQICHRAGMEWPCGHEATAALSRLLNGQEVRCEARGSDRNRRIIGVCWAGHLDISRWMVEQGWAIAYRRFSEDYADAEELARLAKRGLWSGTFDTPEDWRHQRRRPAN